MATKKGIIITGVILASITGASFLLWLIPQNIETEFVISDFEIHLNNVKEIHLTLQTEIDKEFQNMIDEKITPQKYIEIAEISSSQINSQIINLVESGAPVEWHESYLKYIESLQKFNEKTRETIVVASMIIENTNSNKIDESLEKIDLLKKDSEVLIIASDEARP